MAKLSLAWSSWDQYPEPLGRAAPPETSAWELWKGWREAGAHWGHRSWDTAVTPAALKAGFPFKHRNIGSTHLPYQNPIKLLCSCPFVVIPAHPGASNDGDTAAGTVLHLHTNQSYQNHILEVHLYRRFKAVEQRPLQRDSRHL